MAARFRSVTWVFAVALVLASVGASYVASGFGRNAAGRRPTQDQPPRPVFKTEANYVRVDVYPTLDGAPVTDLRRDEFEIFEDTVLQRIDAFERVAIRPVGPQDARREPNTVAESRAMLEDPRARVFVIFLDAYHVEIGGSHDIRRPLVAMLNRAIGQDDLVGVMTSEMLASDVSFARRLTTVEGMLTRYWPWGERDSLVKRDPRDDQYARCYPNTDSDDPCKDQRGIAAEMIDRRREQRTLHALADLVRYLRVAREERKAVLVVSDGWRLFRPDQNLARPLTCHDLPGRPEIGVDPKTGKLVPRSAAAAGDEPRCAMDRVHLAQLDNELEFRRILDEANRSNTTFYPIDPRGLPVFDEPIMRKDVPGPPPPMVPVGIDGSRLRTRTESLRTMAAATDGIAVVSSNDLDRGLKRITDDLSSYYLLGYYSTNTKLDGKFRSINVRVKRPGVQVRARRGYVAPTAAEVAASAPAPATPAAAAAEAEARAIAAALAPLSGRWRDLPLRLQVVAGWKPDRTPMVVVVGEVGAGEDWMAGGDVDIALATAAGLTVATGQDSVAPGVRAFRTVLQSSEPLTPGEYSVRVNLRGAAASGISTDTVRFVLAAAPDASGAIRVRIGPTTGNREVATSDVRFRRSDRIRVEVPAPEAGPAEARLLDRTGKPLAVPAAAAARDEADGSRWQTAQIALSPLAPGDYIVEIKTSQARTLVGFKVVP